ncbi:MAG: helix-turn-helix domain-containing protein [Bdellovibrionaceae bacterium]|nr:helix-turn-helix domain-containing protein [Pseudobdellovibrionaceae bacterium]
MAHKPKAKSKASILPISIRSAEQLGTAILRLRKLNGLNQISLAQKAGVSQATISRLEKGNQKAEIETIILVLAALNADLTIADRPAMDAIDVLEGLF